MSSAGVSGSPTGVTATPSPGLINAAPGSTTATPGETPAGNSGPGAPVTSYNAAQATNTNAQANAYSVPTNATVASQLQGIISSGSPLMQQAETNAKNQMAQRGLINSSQAITAADNSVISAAEPIAAADAATYAQAATNTTNAQNTASLQNSQQANATSQFNAGQTNASLSQAAQASNTVANTAQTIAGQKSIADATNAVNTAIAQLQSNTSLTSEQMQTQSAQIIAQIQANTSLTNQQQQDLTNQVIAQMNNTEALQAIQAQGSVNEQIAQIQGQYGQLTASDSAAQQFYTQGLANLANIVNNNNLSDAEKTQALEDGVQELNDGLATISQIAGTPGVQSTLTFNDGATNTNTGALAA